MMSSYPASSPWSDRFELETAIVLSGLGDRYHPESLIVITGIRIQHAIDALPERYRLLIILRHLQEMSYNEIALVTDLPLGTVKTGIFRARKHLAKVLSESEHVRA